MINWHRSISRIKLSVNCEYFIPIISFNTCFGCSKEPSYLDDSFEYPQHIFWLIFFICELPICPDNHTELAAIANALHNVYSCPCLFLNIIYMFMTALGKNI